MLIQVLAVIALGVVAGLILLLIGQVGLLILIFMKETLHLKIRIGTDKQNE
jgi:hypothetical protein